MYAVRGPDERLMTHLEEIVPLVGRETGLNVAVSAGILTEEQAARLRAAGTHRYNHNLETARSYFGEIVTTHTLGGALRHLPPGARPRHGAVLRRAARHGRDGRTSASSCWASCGRSARPRCRSTSSIPGPGTPLADRPLMAALEAIRWIALFRLALPDVILRYAGGREVTLGDLQEMGMTAGINALDHRQLPDHARPPPQQDLIMLKGLKMPIGSLSKVI